MISVITEFLGDFVTSSVTSSEHSGAAAAASLSLSLSDSLSLRFGFVSFYYYYFLLDLLLLLLFLDWILMRFWAGLIRTINKQSRPFF